MARLAAIGIVIFSIAALVVHYRTSSSRLAYRLSQLRSEQMLLMQRHTDLQMQIATLRSPRHLQRQAEQTQLTVVAPAQQPQHVVALTRSVARY